MEQFFTVQQVASLLDMHPLTIRRYIKSGKLQAVRIGGNVRIAASAIQAFNGTELPPHWQGDFDEMVHPPKVFTLRDPLFQLEGIAQKHRPFLSHFLLLLYNILGRGKNNT